jgi:bifunctional non-homologous end joining protein LigD
VPHDNPLHHLGITPSTYSPCLPTAGKIVPATSAWLHEVKHDGYRLIVVR